MKLKLYFSSTIRWEPGSSRDIDIAELVATGVTVLRLRIPEDPRFLEIDILKPEPADGLPS